MSTMERISVGSVLVCVMCISVHECSGSLIDDFVREYPTAAARLDAAYSHVRIRTKEDQWANASTYLWNCDCVYERNGALVRVVKTITRSTLVETSAGTIRALVGGTDTDFLLRKLPGQRQFVFSNFGTRSSDFEIRAKEECIPLFVVCYGDAADIASYVQRPNTTITSATEKVLDGRRVVEVVLHTKAEGGLYTPSHLYFLPGNWAFMGWTDTIGTIRNESDPHKEFELRARYDNSDPPKLTYVDRWIGYSNDPNHKETEQHIWVQSVRFGPSPAGDFTTVAFGIQQPRMLQSASRARNFWWLLFICIAAVVCGATFYMISRRKRVVSIPPVLSKRHG